MWRQRIISLSSRGAPSASEAIFRFQYPLQPLPVYHLMGRLASLPYRHLASGIRHLSVLRSSYYNTLYSHCRYITSWDGLPLCRCLRHPVSGIRHRPFWDRFACGFHIGS